MDEGGKKKFLYTGPKSKETDSNEKWQFIPQTGASFQKPTIDLDNVWSIKRNVVIGNAQGDNRLTLNASKNYYSRHGGMKDNTTAPTIVQAPSPSPVNYPTWTHNRKGFSYSTHSLANSDTENDSRMIGSNSQGYRGKSNRGLDSHDF